MDDLAAQLSSLIDSPDGMNMIKSLADSLLGGEGAQNDAAAPAQTENTASQGSPFSAKELETFMKISGALRSGKDDDRARLLLALRPHLSPERQKKVDKAIKLLKIVDLLPILKESGLELF